MIKLQYHTNWSVLTLQSQVMTHEIGHMFGIKHCVYHNCAMNGSNHLAESDRRAASLCPICLRKLQVFTIFSSCKRVLLYVIIFTPYLMIE